MYLCGDDQLHCKTTMFEHMLHFIYVIARVCMLSKNDLYRVVFFILYTRRVKKRGRRVAAEGIHNCTF